MNEFSKSPAYIEYLKLLKYVKQLKDDRGLSDDCKEYPDDFFSDIETYLRYMPFKQLGAGSSRTAYLFDADNRYILKTAHSNGGIDQNKVEIKNFQTGTADYKCFVRILTNSKDNLFVIEDFCKQSTYEDWDRIIGISPNMLSKIIRIIFERKTNNKKYSLCDFRNEIKDRNNAAEVLKKTFALDDDFQVSNDYNSVISCVNNMIAAYTGKTKQYKWVSLVDFIRFYCDNGMSTMIPEELLYVDQWGVKTGDTPDNDALIIIDSGAGEL